MYEAWYQQIEEMAARANAWCNFALGCAWIGFGLSVVALVWLVIIMRREANERGTDVETNSESK